MSLESIKMYDGWVVEERGGGWVKEVVLERRWLERAGGQEE